MSLQVFVIQIFIPMTFADKQWFQVMLWYVNYIQVMKHYDVQMRSLQT